MNVRQLIEMLEEFEDQEMLVFVKSGQDDGSCCQRGEPEWDEASSAGVEMIQDRVWNSTKKRIVARSVNVVKIDVY